ncbi:MAG: TonB family protein [Bacteroidaceae bacterium]|nr:TonB family protein [Bacteroidaceae bacterium]
MKQIAILVFMFCFASARAQFFFDFSPRQQMEQRREKYTAPSYKKGEAGIKAYIQKNFKQVKQRENVDGRIIIAVMVNAKGNVEDAQVVRSVTSALDAEAIRVCRKMTFKPATLGKKKTKGRIDIVFPIRNGRLSYLNLPTTEV